MQTKDLSTINIHPLRFLDGNPAKTPQSCKVPVAEQQEVLRLLCHALLLPYRHGWKQGGNSRKHLELMHVSRLLNKAARRPLPGTSGLSALQGKPTSLTTTQQVSCFDPLSARSHALLLARAPILPVFAVEAIHHLFHLSLTL